MKKTLLIAAIASVTMANAQSIEGTFENPALVSADTSWFGQDQVTDGDTIYYNDNFNMELSYNADWGSFSGWSVSNTSDVTTPGWTNQFSAITGEGHSSDQYGVCYVTPWNNNRLFYEEEETPTFGGMYVTNTTYAYLSMLNGDSFAKKFGEDTSATGVIDGTNGEDWFLLTIYGLGLDSLPTGDSVNFYLADYRFENDGDDYIVDSWEYVDLTSLGSVHGLDFVLTSSDTAGGFGMNTPAYFAMDDINAGWASIEEEEMVQLSAFPNPFNDQLNIQLAEDATLLLFDLNGRLIKEEKAFKGTVVWDLADLESGIYTLISNGKTVYQSKLIKQ